MARARKRADPEQFSLGVDDGALDQARLRKYNADFTPQGASFRVCLALRDDLGLDPPDIKDPNAGAGGFGWMYRRLWPSSRTSAVEIREEEAEHLAANYDEHELGDYCSLPTRPASVSAMITNPDFDRALEVADKALVELVPGGWLALLLRLTWGDNRDVSTWLRKNPPWGCIELDGRLCFRSGINPNTGRPWDEDSVTYRVWIWRPGLGRLTASRGIDIQRYIKLDRLPDEDRQWLRIGGMPVRPGTEYMYDASRALYLPPQRPAGAAHHP